MRADKSVLCPEISEMNRNSLDNVIERDIVNFKYTIHEKELENKRLKRELKIQQQTECELLNKLTHIKQLTLVLEEKSQKTGVCAQCNRKLGSLITSLQISDRKVDTSYGEKSFKGLCRLSSDYNKHVESILEEMSIEIRFLNNNKSDLEKGYS